MDPKWETAARRQPENGIMDQGELFDRESQLYNANVFTHFFSLETSRAMRYQELFSIFLLDIDRPANDPAKETSIREITQIISHNLRNELRGTDLIGHLGKEIVVLLLHAGEEEISAIAQRIQDRIENFAFPLHLTGPSRRLTISIGAACFPKSGSTDSTLLANARLGLRKAQQCGGNCYATVGDNPDGEE